MNETSFVSKHQSKVVVAARGSSSVWTKVPEASFHLSVVVAVSTDGTAVLPLFIAPGKRINRATMDGCSIPGAGIITAEKGFLNANIFELWIGHFADSMLKEHWGLIHVTDDIHLQVVHSSSQVFIELGQDRIAISRGFLALARP